MVKDTKDEERAFTNTSATKKAGQQEEPAKLIDPVTTAANEPQGGANKPESEMTAEERRQKLQREETQTFLDAQEESRQQMATQTRLREEREKKARGNK